MQVADLPRLQAELARLNPAELLLAKTAGCKPNSPTSPVERGPWLFDLTAARKSLTEHFKVRNLEAFGCDDLALAISAAAVASGYARETQFNALEQVSNLKVENASNTVILDPGTRRHLELVENARQQESNTLFSVSTERQTRWARANFVHGCSNRSVTAT